MKRGSATTIACPATARSRAGMNVHRARTPVFANLDRGNRIGSHSSLDGIRIVGKQFGSSTHRKSSASRNAPIIFLGPRPAKQVTIIHQEVNFSYGRSFFAVPIILRSLRTLIAARALILVSSI